MFSRRAISSHAMDTRKSLQISSLTTFLYWTKFSGVMSFLISSSAIPLSRMSVIMTAYFSRAELVTRVSGTSTSILSASALARASFRSSTNSFASSSSMAFRSSFSRSAAVIPARTFSANSSVTSGVERWDASLTVTSKIAFLPARVLSLNFSGKETVTILVSPTLAPTRPSTRPSMYRPGPKMTSTSSPLAALGRGSAFETPSSAAMNPTMLTTHASPMASAPPSSIGARVA
mmetsp:Transcript_27298/g.49594  ORF Transcript_27298/g.49594 Transcript_27298/m.49594 type:complete len:233 (-) Transcript_27298:543-1241(-)